MASLRTLIRRSRTAVLLGAAAAVAAHLPPFDIAARVDGAIYDVWTRLAPRSAPPDVVVVSLEDPAWFATLVEIADRENARLVIATLSQPPSPAADELALGPTELAFDRQLLRSTEWSNGGHLWFEAQTDGVVRRDATLLGEAASIPSLAFSAARELGHTGGSGDRRWLRFFAPASFTRMTPEQILAEPGLVAGNVVIAGHGEPAYATPVGALAAHDLVAQALAGYRDDVAIRSGALGSAVAWALGLLILAGAALRARLLGSHWAFLAASGGALLGSSALAFHAASLWMPPAGPLILALTAGGLLAARPGRRARQPSATGDLEEARRALAVGDFEQAWRLYRNIPPTAAVLDELYELAARLEQNDFAEHAADAFHRIALVNARYRDVAERLVAATRPDSERGADVMLRGTKVSTLGRYELLAQIGQGSTGKVLLGRDPHINRLLAIKVIELSASLEPGEIAEAGDRFRREAETAGRLNHPNIVTVFDIGESDGLAYIAMEYLKGRHLSDFARPGALLPPALVLELAAQTAEALHYAHGQNVVHRDIKPANIMYDSVSGALKITDFGIARLIDVSRTRTGIILGTPSFMAPEQMEGGNVNGHTDLFALGVSLYQLLTGRLPFRGASMTKLMFVIANEPHRPITAARPDLPEQLDALIDAALAKDPANRFRSGAEMADALRAAAAQFG